MSAERDRKIQAYSQAHQQLLAALERFPHEMWKFRPAPGEWSIHEMIIHIADSEANSYVRLRRFLAEPGSDVLGYDQDVWARQLDYHQQDTAAALELFKWLRLLSTPLLLDLPEAAWASTVRHSEYGPITLDDWLTTYARHVEVHIAQMQANYAAWLKQRED